MRPSDRLFELIQILRAAAGPLTAASLAMTLEVSTRTVYRDIAALQRMRVPIEGAAGIGYLLRPGYDLPPLAFTEGERDALSVALRLLGRLGDTGLEQAARSAAAKLATAQPSFLHPSTDTVLHVSPWTRTPPAGVDFAMVRIAIRDERALALAYLDSDGAATARIVLPMALIYYVDVIVLAGWCRLRQAFRHFRADRITRCALHQDRFTGQGDRLRATWQQSRVPGIKS